MGFIAKSGTKWKNVLYISRGFNFYKEKTVLYDVRIPDKMKKNVIIKSAILGHLVVWNCHCHLYFFNNLNLNYMCLY
jgi:hypothetical protein